MDNKKAIEYFYRQMELGNIKNDIEQEVFELAIQALEKMNAPNLNIKEDIEILGEMLEITPLSKREIKAVERVIEVLKGAK